MQDSMVCHPDQLQHRQQEQAAHACVSTCPARRCSTTWASSTPPSPMPWVLGHTSTWMSSRSMCKPLSVSNNSPAAAAAVSGVGVVAPSPPPLLVHSTSSHHAHTAAVGRRQLTTSVCSFVAAHTHTHTHHKTHAARCLDQYFELRVKEVEQKEQVEIDPRLVDVVERMLDRCVCVWTGRGWQPAAAAASKQGTPGCLSLLCVAGCTTQWHQVMPAATPGGRRG